MYCHLLVQSEIGHDPSDINQRKAERQLDQWFSQSPVHHEPHLLKKGLKQRLLGYSLDVLIEIWMFSRCPRDHSASSTVLDDTAYLFVLKIFTFTKLGTVWVPLGAQTVKSPPAMWETRVRSLGWEDPLEETWPPTPVFLTGESHGQRSPVSYIIHGVAKSWTQLSD